MSQESPCFSGGRVQLVPCQVGVSLHLAHGRASAAIDWRLFVPVGWDPAPPEADPAKVAAAATAASSEAEHAEKWHLFPDMIDEARS
ncbi:transposase [Streptomyces sp. NPDC055722]